MFRNTHRAAGLPGDVAIGKTGTSSGNRDARFVGSACGVTTGVWFGRLDGAPARGLTGGALPAEVFRHFMANYCDWTRRLHGRRERAEAGGP